MKWHLVKFKWFRPINVSAFLELTGNKLSNVPSTQLSILRRLEELYIGKNFISSLQPHAFPRMRTLKILDMSNNINLSFVSKNAFQVTTKIIYGY